MLLNGNRKLAARSVSAHGRNALTTAFAAALVSLSLAGCGRVVAQKATEQLIAGDAVDRSVAQIDFRVLTGKKVFLDTQYVNKTVVGVGFVTSDYIISSLRQKMMCDGCLLEEKVEQADFVVEMRIGALGADGHEIVFGMPPNNFMSLAASVTPTSSPAAAILPTMPELSVAKKDDQMAAAKVALFAYNRRTREPIWQSGISESRSLAVDRWYFGAGPFHKGSIYASKKDQDPSLFSSDEAEAAKTEYFVERRFADPTKSLAESPPDPKPTVAAATTPAAAAPAAGAPAAGAPAAAAPAVAAPAVAAAAPATAAPATAAPPATAPAATPPATAAAPAAAPPATATAAATPNPPAPGAAVPVTAAAPAATPTAAATPVVTPAQLLSIQSLSTQPLPIPALPIPALPTQTVNAAPAVVAAPAISATPTPSPAPAAAAAAAPPVASPATGSASAPTNAAKTVPSVNSTPGVQPANEATGPVNVPTVVPPLDMRSVSLP
jgi:hypothetical protein